MRLEENVLLSHASNRRDDAGVSGDSGASPPTLTKEYFLSGVEDDYIALAYSLSATDTSVATPAALRERG